MLDQFINSTLSHFKKIEPMAAYVQKTPTKVQYPCMLVNNVNIRTELINSYMYENVVTLYVRVFGKHEIETKNKAYNIVQTTIANMGKIPVLNEDGSDSKRYIRVEEMDIIDIPVDENEVFCSEISFTFVTSHEVNYKQFEKLAKVFARAEHY